MISYFGRDDQGYFADSEDGTRQYLEETLWHQLIEAGAHAGADVSQAGQPGALVSLRITEHITVEKFDA